MANENPGQDEIRGEIEAFLRRMQQQPQGSPPPAPPRPPKPPKQRRSQNKQPPRPAVPPPIDAPQPRRETIAEHVQQHLGAQQFSERASHLTKVDQADEQLEDHLKQAFDHKLGTLANRHLAGEDSSVLAAAPLVEATKPQLNQILADPHQLRNAVILSEILRRPEERW